MKKLLALILMLVMCASVFGGCVLPRDEEQKKEKELSSTGTDKVSDDDAQEIIEIEDVIKKYKNAIITRDLTSYNVDKYKEEQGSNVYEIAEKSVESINATGEDLKSIQKSGEESEEDINNALEKLYSFDIDLESIKIENGTTTVKVVASYPEKVTADKEKIGVIEDEYSGDKPWLEYVVETFDNEDLIVYGKNNLVFHMEKVKGNWQIKNIVEEKKVEQE